MVVPKNPTRHKGVIIEAESEKVLWTCEHLHGQMAGAKRCASRQRDRLFKVSSKNVLAHDRTSAASGVNQGNQA
jgi:hypothetical protein